METIQFNVPSISCSVCAEKIKNGITELEGIGNVLVDLKAQVVKVDYNPQNVQPKDIRKKVQDLGYEIVQ